VIGFAQLWMANQATDALALLPKLLQQEGIFGAIQLFKLQANSFRQRRAMSSGRNGDLQSATPEDGGGDEVARVRRIDNIDPDVMFPCSLTHGPIYRCVIGGADDERTAQDIVGAKRSSLRLNGALRCKSGQGF
jgi:hypothetical protein